MNYLRGHKGSFPGKEKFKEVRRLNQVTRQKAARSSLLQGLRAFLTADSFMYGPLMDTPISPPTVHSSGGLDLRTPGMAQCLLKNLPTVLFQGVLSLALYF